MTGHPIDIYYVVRRETEREASESLRGLEAFLRTPGGSVRLDGPDRVVVWRDGATLYLSPGAMSLAGYLDPAPDSGPRNPVLLGPDMSPPRFGAPLVPSAQTSARDLPSSAI